MYEIIGLFCSLMFLCLSIYINQKNIRLERKGRALLHECKKTNKEICKNIEINDNLLMNIKNECIKHPEFWKKIREQLEEGKVH